MKELFDKYRSVITFFATGVIVLVFNLGLLFLLTDILHLHYIVSSVAAYICAVGLNFTLQKFWVFQNRSREEAKKQAAQYFAVSLAYTALNTLFMYLLVDIFRAHYLLAQTIITGALAVANYFINKKYIFVS